MKKLETRTRNTRGMSAAPRGKKDETLSPPPRLATAATAARTAAHGKAGPGLFARYLPTRGRLESARVAQRRKTGQRGPVPNTIDAQQTFRTPGFTTNHAFDAIDGNRAVQVFNNRNVLVSTIVKMTDNEAKSEVKHGFSNRAKAGAQPVPGGVGAVTGGPFPTEKKYDYILFEATRDFVQKGSGILKVATHYEAGQGYRLGHLHGIGARSDTATGTATRMVNNPNRLANITFV